MRPTLSFLLALALSLNAFAQRWEPYNELPDLYPSLAIATANLTADPTDPDNAHNLGDLNGIMGIVFTGARANSRVQVRLTCSGGLPLFDPAQIDVVVPKAGEEYIICPVVPFDQTTLASIRQVQTIYINYTVSIDGKAQPRRTERLLVQPINVCPFGVTYDDDTYESLDFMFAAYVNEDHPQVDKILQTALRQTYVDSFAGYQGEELGVYRQVLAIWRVLQERGIRYSSVTTTVADTEAVASQHVRLLDESINNTQANCVDGSVLFASVLRKIGLEPILVTIPGHMFVGFDLDEAGRKQAFLETTMLGSDPREYDVTNNTLARSLLTGVSDGPARTATERFVAAIQAGNKSYAKHRKDLENDHADFSVLRVSDARKSGILPIMYVAGK
jgi:hypothetical protein